LRADIFAPRNEWLTNKFVWYGTTKPFECLTLTFRESEHGAFVAHHYRYAPDRSTSSSSATRHVEACGLHAMDDAASRRTAKRCSRPTSTGIRSSRTGRSGELPAARECALERGKRRADRRCPAHRPLLDRIRAPVSRSTMRSRSIARSAKQATTCRAFVAAFERERRPVVEKLVAAANSSSYWYERLADKMALGPVELAYDYMTRSGRVDDARLTEMAPRFMHEVRAAGPFGDARIVDPVPRETSGAREIGVCGARALQRVVAPLRQPGAASRQGRARVRRAPPHVRSARGAGGQSGRGHAQHGSRAGRPRADVARRHAGIRSRRFSARCAPASCRCS
jgi:hypothetical protein